MANVIIRKAEKNWDIKIPREEPNKTYYSYLLGIKACPIFKENVRKQLKKLGFQAQYQDVCTLQCDSYYGCTCPDKYCYVIINSL